METKLKDINTKLVDISTQYSKFNKNQVLTETQLNGFLDYFDDQHRLTRTSLSGVGIVCGFQIKLNEDDSIIEITQGRGVTTDGDLIALQKPSKTEEGKKDNTIKSIDFDLKTFKYFKKFTDNEANYDHFIDADNKQIDLWELYETNADSRTKLSSFPGEDEVVLNLSNMVVLLYLESYSKEGDLCTQLTCDSQGIEQVSRLRVLLVSEDDAKYIASKDGIYNKHDWYETYTSLPEVSVKRIVLNTKNTKTYRRLKQSYYNAIKDNNIIDKLIKGVDLIIKELGIKKDVITPHIQKVFNFDDIKIPVDFQYRYDALKDFIDTYNEIKEILLDLNVHCCPEFGAFPKHLMLGKLNENKPYATFRHEFYKSPIINCEDSSYKKLMSLLTKLKEISKNYNFLNKEENIKITPSKALDTLSNKAVPYYYHVNDSVLKYWNFEKNQNLRHRFNLSYHTSNLVNVPSIQQPLDHNLDHFNFYRIEGHQGKTYREALEIITKIKEGKGLNFDVKVLSVETDKRSIELKNYKCQFEDLKILLDAWKAEQDCVLGEVSRFLSAFSTERAGKNWLSEKKGYNSLVEKRKEKLLEDEKNQKKEIEEEKEKIKKYEEELAKKKREEMSEEDINRVKEFELALKKLVESGQKEKAEALKREYDLYLKGIEESKMSEEEKSRVKEFESSLKDLKESGDKAKEEERKREYEEYLKELEKAKMSDEEIEKRKKYENSLKKYEASMRKMEAVSVSAKTSSHESYSDKYFGNPKKEEIAKEAEAKKREQDAIWKRMGYKEEVTPKKNRYDDVWAKLGAVNIKAASEREKRKQKNVVKEVLINEENTVGELFNKILEENPKASKNEILTLVKKEMLEVSKGEAWQEKEEMKKFILEDTAEVLVNAYVLDNEIPKEIEDIDKEGLSKYKVTINELCERVKQLQSSYDSLDLDSGTKQIIGLLINQLSTVCCSGKKLEILYDEIQKRKDDILIQTKLSEFVKKHPGLEHKAGVKPGGTFVMVYLKEAEEEKVVYENALLEIPFLNQPQVKEEGKGGERGILQLLGGKQQITFTFVDQYLEESEVSRFEAVVIGETIEKTVNNLSEYLNRMFNVVGISEQIKAGAKDNVLLIGIVDEIIHEKTSFIEFENPATVEGDGPIYFEANKIEKSSVTVKNTVVADFSLPYMCCTDCAPVNFIIPKAPVKLSLLEKHVCLKEGETVDPMEFKVSPLDGEIAAIVPEGIQSGLTFDGHGKAYFDASLTDSSLHGKEIGFTVNEELTDCTVIVYADVPLSITTSIEYNTLKTVATVTYKVSNVYPNLNHNWDFGNEIISNQIPNAEGIIVITYQLPVENNNTIKPRLTVTNGICEKEVLIEPITFDDAIEVSLGIIESYCLDRNSTDKVLIPFTNKNPQEAIIKIVGEPVEGLFIKNDELTIVPENFEKFNEPIQFTLAGSLTTASIKISPEPSLSVTTRVEYNELKTSAIVYYTVSERNPDWTYTWDDGNGNTFQLIPNETENSIKITYEDLPVNDTNTIKPSLRVNNGQCEKEITIEPITFEDGIDVSLNIIDSICLDRNSQEKVLVPFTNKNPQEMSIGIVGETIEGLIIENDQLIIAPAIFTKFNDRIQFTMDGFSTNAEIIIGIGTEMNVEAQEKEYSWNGEDLYQTFNLIMEASDITNDAQVSRKWEINGVEKGTGQSLQHPFLIDKEGSIYEVVATLKNENGCISTEQITLNIPYPEFEMKMSNELNEYCLDDQESYPVSVSPKIPNTPYTGKGISEDTDGNVEFSPTQAGLVSQGIVQLGILNETLLSLQLNDKAKAKFEWSIVDEILYIKNTSEVADKYSFVIGEYSFERANRRNLKRSVHDFKNAVIDVSITAHNPCGINTFEIKGIKIREEEPPANCVDETHSRIKDDNERLPQNVDLPSDVRMIVIDTTNSLYEMVLAAPEMLNDGMTSGIGSFGNLFTETVSQIERFVHKQYERGILSEYFIAQIKLFYNMIHCQPHDALNADEGMIMQNMEELRKNLEKLRNRRIKFDVNNELKDFLKMYKDSPEVVSFVKEVVKNQILPEIL